MPSRSPRRRPSRAAGATSRVHEVLGGQATSKRGVFMRQAIGTVAADDDSHRRPGRRAATAGPHGPPVGRRIPPAGTTGATVSPARRGGRRGRRDARITLATRRATTAPSGVRTGRIDAGGEGLATTREVANRVVNPACPASRIAGRATRQSGCRPAAKAGRPVDARTTAPAANERGVATRVRAVDSTHLATFEQDEVAGSVTTAERCRDADAP